MPPADLRDWQALLDESLSALDALQAMRDELEQCRLLEADLAKKLRQAINSLDQSTVVSAESLSTLLAIAGANTVNEAIAPLLIASSGYWRTHHDVCAAPCRLPPAFVGRSRALEIVINVVLPVACATGDAALAANARALFARLPRPAVYGATKFIEAALASEGIRVPVNARRAQGLVELQRNWCTQNGCGRCSLSG